MDRLEQIKNEVSKEHYDCSWASACLFFMLPEDVENLMKKVALRYATEVARHNLERAADECKDIAVDAYESITSLEIELI